MTPDLPARLRAHAEARTSPSPVELLEAAALLEAQAGAGADDTTEKRVMRWMTSQDVGASSESLACQFLGLTPRFGFMEPADSADFGRCFRLLLQFPEMRPAVDLLAAKDVGWAKLAPIWDDLMHLGHRDGLYNRGRYSEEISKRIRAARWPARPEAPR